MSHPVQMPALGESVTEGTVTRWLKNEGDQVTEDEPLLEVSTDKVDTEVPAPYSGVLERILVHEDETVEVGADLAIIGDGSGGGSADSSGQADTGAQAEPAQQQPAPEPEAAPRSEQPSEAPSTETEQPAAAPQAAEQQAPGDGGGDAASGTQVTMPAMGESVTEGTVTRWLKQVGDTVEVDEPLLEISTDKVDTEMPSPVGGTLLQILAQEDETVEVGAPVAIIGAASAAAAPQPPAPEPAQPPAPEPAQQPAPQQPAPQAAPAPSPETPPAAPTAPAAAPQPTAPAATPPAAPPATSAAPAQAAPPPAPRPPAPAWQPAAPQRAQAYVTPVVRKLAADSGVDLTELKVDGGMIANDTLMQFQADILGVPVVRPVVAETTALGAAYAAGLAVGFWNDLDELRANWQEDKRWTPNDDVAERERQLRLWKKAVTKSMDWVDADVN